MPAGLKDGSREFQKKFNARVVQLVRTRSCQDRGRGFEAPLSLQNMAQRRYKVKNYKEELEKYLKNSVLSGKAKKIIEIGGKPIKLPKKTLTRPEESYRRFPKKFKQAP